MAKITRKETKELAALTVKMIKQVRPDLGNKEVRAICSAVYHMSKGE